jgi:hypothetical protein
LSQNAN